jgi:hypothetical protein
LVVGTFNTNLTAVADLVARRLALRANRLARAFRAATERIYGVFQNWFPKRAVSAQVPGGGTPQGLVTFSLDGMLQGSAPLVNGTTSLTLASPPAGAHTLTAV